MIARTPEPPYVAVIFTAQQTSELDGYEETAAAMQEAATRQPGYLGVESVADAEGVEITVSYWRTEQNARDWKQVAEHLAAQGLGRSQWYEAYEVRVATVTRHYGFERDSTGSG
jgi:heme-degrading monooxygenase HmoA